MAVSVRDLIGILWLAWLAYWVIAAGMAKPVERRETPLSRAVHVVPLTAGAVLMAWPHPPHWLSARFMPPGAFTGSLGVAILAGGLAFATWARMHLGGNWSGTVTLKQDHELIRSGPYRLVRHPIYTGLLAALLGTALSLGEWRGLVALALIAAAFVRKMRIEEQFMRENFGDAYGRYRAEVPALIPFVY